MNPVAVLDLWLGEHLSQRFAARVVVDDQDGRLLYVQRGSATWRAILPEGARHLRDIPHDERPDDGYEFHRSVWTNGSALILQPRDEGFAIWTLLDDELEVTGWYVNFEERYARCGVTAIRDFELDLVITRGGSITVKDAESFLARTGLRGHWSTDDVAYLPAAFRDVASRVERRREPFIRRVAEGVRHAITSMTPPGAPPYPTVRRINGWT